MKDTMQPNAITTEARPECVLCKGHGEVIYRDLEHRLFDATGHWTLKVCPGSGCGLIWLDPMLTKKDIGKAYLNYYTHEDENIQKPKKRGGVVRRLKRAFSVARNKDTWISSTAR